MRWFVGALSSAVFMSGSVLADTPKVVTDIPPVQALMSRVMAGVGTPELVMRPGASPHGYALRPSEAGAIEAADLVVWVGPALTPWLDRAIDTLAGDAVHLTLMNAPGTTLLPMRSGAHFEAHDHGHGDHEGHDHDEHAHDDHEGHDHDEHAHDDHEGHDHDEHAHDDHEGHDHDEHAHDDHEGHDHEGHDHDEHAHDDHEGHDHDEHAHDDHEGHDHDEHAHDDHEGHDHDEHAHDDHEDHDHDEHAHDDHEGHDHDEHAHDDHEGHDHDEHAHDDHEGHDHDEHAGHDEHDHGDEGLDPHAWLAPENAIVWLDAMAAALSRLDPENADTYASNAAEGAAEIAAAVTDARATLAPFQDGKFIVFHDAYQYFEISMGVSATGAISVGDATDPGPARVSEIQHIVRDLGVTCVFSEPQFNPRLVATVSEGTDAKSAVLDPLGTDLDLDADMYPALIRALSAEMAGCL